MYEDRLFISTNAQPLPPTGPPSLALSLVLKTARIAFGNELELDLDDIECICSSLMDQVRSSSSFFFFSLLSLSSSVAYEMVRMVK
jgi:hypothetical protein